MVKQIIKIKIILDKIQNNETDLLIGTHALFQNKIKFKKLGYTVIDEQHKFGVKQRMRFADKGGANCDVPNVIHSNAQINEKNIAIWMFQNFRKTY